MEIGPGEGFIAELYRNAEIDYHGLEANEIMQADLVQRGFDVCLAQVPPIPSNSEMFDLLVAIAVIEHTPTEATELLIECRRVLKGSGFACFLFPDYTRSGFDFYAWDYSHSFLTTEKRVEQLLSDTGFSCVRTVRFSGSVTTSPLRFAIDLAMLLIHNRTAYFLGESLGLNGILYKLHKTFQASSLVIAKKM